MQRSLIVIVVLLVGAAAYTVGATSREPRDETTRHAEPNPAPKAAGERAQNRPLSDRRAEALLQELLESNRALRSAIEALTAELHAGDDDARAGSAQHVATSAEQWVERLRAREPDVVLDAVCRLRATMLTRALQDDARAASEVGPIVGTLTPDELRAAQRTQEQNAQILRGRADACRRAIGELDSVRTIEDLARWRVRHGEFQ